MKLEITINNAEAELKNVNLRTENNGDERVLAVDLKVLASIPAKDVAPLFSDAPDLLDTLYDEGGNVLATCFEHIYRVPIENIELAIDDLKPFVGGKVKKGMKLIPRNGKRFEVMLTAQLSDVGDVRPLAKRLHEEVKITIIERQQSLGLDEAA